MGHGFHFGLSDSPLQGGERIKNISTIDFPIFAFILSTILAAFGRTESGKMFA